MPLDAAVGLFTYAEAITPADADLSNGPFSLYIGVGGNLRVTTVKGQDVTFENVLGGTFFPGRFKRVWDTNTSASSIIGVR